MIGRTTLALGVTTALVFGLTSVIHVEPIKAAWSGWTASQPPGNYVSEVLTLNVDSLGPPGYCELFVGDQQGSGDYQLSVRSYPGGLLDLATASASPPATGHRWLEFTLTVTYPESLVRGRRYEFHWSRANGARIQYYYQDASLNPTSPNPYPYGFLKVNGQGDSAKDLCCRISGRLNAVGSAYWTVDQPDFVPWGDNNPGGSRSRLRHWSAKLADSAAVGSMMIYAKWPELLDNNGPTDTRSWYDFDAKLWAVVDTSEANARPIVNITQVAKSASSRQAFILKRQWVPDMTSEGGHWEQYEVWDTTTFCAPKNLLAPITADTNYWADYIHDLMTHVDKDASRQWPGGDSVPGKQIHVVEIWNETNDTCVDSRQYFFGDRGWWRRPTEQYDSGYDGLAGLCALYVRMASVAEQVIHNSCGSEHLHDTILICATNGALSGDTINQNARGVDFVRYCYQAATQLGGPGIFWDGLSIHPYRLSYDFDPVSFETMAESIRAVARSYGDYDCQLWCSEMGPFYLYEDWTSRDTMRKYYQNDVARFLPELYTTAIASQALPGARYDQCQWWWFSTLDTSYPCGMIGLKDIYIWDPRDTGGCWQKYGSFYPCQQLAAQLTGWRFEQRVGVDNPSGPQVPPVRVYEFSEPTTEQRRWVGWVVQTTGRESLLQEVKIPARTDTVEVSSDSGPRKATADADGWLRLDLSTYPRYLKEVSLTSRPDLRVDSVRYVASQPQCTVRVWVTNHGERATPNRSTPPSPYPTYAVLRANGDSLAQRVRTTAIPKDVQVLFTFTFSPGLLPDTALLSVIVNPSQTYVELGTDDNTGHVLAIKP